MTTVRVLELVSVRVLLCWQSPMLVLRHLRHLDAARRPVNGFVRHDHNVPIKHALGYDDTEDGEDITILQVKGKRRYVAAEQAADVDASLAH